MPPTHLVHIPTCLTRRSLINSRDHLLLWVRTGTAEVTIQGTSHHVEAGQALWIRAGIAHSAKVARNSLAMPLFLPITPELESLGNVRRITIPDEWEPWLIWHFALKLGYLRVDPHEPTELIGLVTEQSPTDVDLAHYVSPLLPHSPEALGTAHHILMDPASDTPLSDFSGMFSVSSRTLQRQFSLETGLGFTEWRRRARIAAAMDYLRNGHPVSWVGHTVGFKTPAGFTRAFRKHAGYNPSEFRRQYVSTNASSNRMSSSSSGNNELIHSIVALSRNKPHQAPPFPAIPASSTWRRINPFHIGVWLYCGSARAYVGEHDLKLVQGDALWLPAGVHNRIELEPGSVILPLWSRPADGVESSLTTPQVVHFPHEMETYLLHSAVAAWTALKPLEDSSQPLIGALCGGLTRQSSDTAMPDVVTSDTIPAATIDPIRELTASLHHNPADRRTLADWAAHFDIERARLHKAFIATTGETFPQWRAKLRMSTARLLLRQGLNPTTVARRLGYAHLSGFSRLFTATFGVSPRQYQIDQH